MGYHLSAPYLLWQKKVLAVLPKVSGTLSAIFSCLIIWTILRDKKRRSRTYHRIMLGISLCDLSSSFWFFLSTWPMPRGTATWAVGNDTTCNLQGFWTQFSVSSSFYNASLSIYYLLVVRFGWKEHELLFIERWFLHTIPILWSLVSAIVGLSLGVYGNASLWCWASPLYPVFRYAAFYGPLWLMIVIVTINTVLVYDHVRRIEKAANRHRFVQSTADPLASSEGGGRVSRFSIVSRSSISGTLLGDGTSLQFENGTNPVRRGSVQLRSDQRRERRRIQLQRKSQRTREVANQCILYTSAFYLEWSALTATRIIQQINGKTYFPLLVMAAITVPMQGLPNFLVYLLPRFKRLRKEKFWPWIRQVLHPQGGSGNDFESTAFSEAGLRNSRLSMASQGPRYVTGSSGRLRVFDEDAGGVSESAFSINTDKPLHDVDSDNGPHFDLKAIFGEQMSEFESENEDDEVKHADETGAVPSSDTDTNPTMTCQDTDYGTGGENPMVAVEAASGEDDDDMESVTSPDFRFQDS